ncbi:hypothetical protein SAMN04487901_10711 [Prevotella communis]|uniref:Uncharacterized protein n=1 Tax=Prevotella communis TaxID=2913614 RepID=A0A1H0HZB5_9BACT|nr:hypothetical protein SAMN04487901_10711 [Prevotella communis]SDO24552.1 hypothetical protein SAMN04487900_11282 [Prevotella communis]
MRQINKQRKFLKKNDKILGDVNKIMYLCN